MTHSSNSVNLYELDRILQKRFWVNLGFDQHSTSRRKRSRTVTSIHLETWGTYMKKSQRMRKRDIGADLREMYADHRSSVERPGGATNRINVFLVSRKITDEITCKTTEL